MPTFNFETKSLELIILWKLEIPEQLWAIKFGTVSHYGIYNGKMVPANWNSNFCFFGPPKTYLIDSDKLSEYCKFSKNWKISMGFEGTLIHMLEQKQKYPWHPSTSEEQIKHLLKKKVTKRGEWHTLDPLHMKVWGFGQQPSFLKKK